MGDGINYTGDLPRYGLDRLFDNLIINGTSGGAVISGGAIGIVVIFGGATSGSVVISSGDTGGAAIVSGLISSVSSLSMTSRWYVG